MLIQPRPLVPFTFERRIFKPYLLRVEFSTDDAAPLTSPYIGEVGSLTVTDTGDKYVVSSGELVPVSSSTGNLNPLLRGDALSRVSGLAVKARVRRVSAFGSDARGGRMGWLSNLADAVNMDAILSASVSAGAGAVQLGANMDGMTAQATSLYPLSDDVDADVAVVLRSSGAFYFVNSTLIWVSDIGNAPTVYPVIAAFGTNRKMLAADFLRVWALGSSFATDYGIAAVHTSASSGSDYAAVANGIFDLVISAPASLAGEAGLKFRKNGGDFWKVNFDSSGSLIVQRYVSDVAQGSPVSLASSVISSSATRTIRVIANGANMDFYTLSGTSWTKRGSTQTDSHLSANTGISPFADASWTTGGGALGQIDAYARTASSYDILDSI